MSQSYHWPSHPSCCHPSPQLGGRWRIVSDPELHTRVGAGRPGGQARRMLHAAGGLTAPGSRNQRRSNWILRRIWQPLRVEGCDQVAGPAGFSTGLPFLPWERAGLDWWSEREAPKQQAGRREAKRHGVHKIQGIGHRQPWVRTRRWPASLLSCWAQTLALVRSRSH